MLAAGWSAASLARADAALANPTTLPFASGGVIVMKISQGEIEVVGVAEDRIRVTWQAKGRSFEGKAKVRLEQPAGNQALVAIEGWDDRLRYRIEVPRRSDVAIHMRAGELKVGGIDGSLDIDLIAGEINLSVPDPARYKAVRASVTAGQLTATPWRTDESGLWRSF